MSRDKKFILTLDDGFGDIRKVTSCHKHIQQVSAKFGRLKIKQTSEDTNCIFCSLGQRITQ